MVFSLLVSRDYFLVAVHGLLIPMASPVAEHRLSGEWASVAGAHGPSSPGSQALEHRLNPRACGIFPDQGSNLSLLHWQMDSLILSHQGRPRKLSFP